MRLFRPPLTPPNLGGETITAVGTDYRRCRHDRACKVSASPPKLGGETITAVGTDYRRCRHDRACKVSASPPKLGGVRGGLNKRLLYQAFFNDY